MARILIVDDEELVRLTIRQFLERAGHEVTEAGNGNEGLRQVEAVRPDLVISDIIMPDREGIETIHKIRQDHPGIKIIAISGGGRIGTTDFLEIAAKVGADRTLAKPFTRDTLLQAVNDCLTKARRAGEGE